MDYILNCAGKLIQKYKTRNPFELAKCLNVKILFRQLGDLKGFYTCDRRERYIVLNQDLSETMSLLICAHELGHDRLHRHFAKFTPLQDLYIYDMSSKPEREANIFAAEILLTDDKVLEVINDNISFFSAANILHIPPELLDFKFQILKKKGYRLESQIEARGDFLKK